MNTIKSINQQILTNKSRFFISFYSHYFFKALKIKNPIPFPVSQFRFQNIRLNTRPNTIDFWACLETYEPDLTYFLIEALKDKKGSFIDVGTHIGRFTVLTAKNGWEVTSFEPIKSNYDAILGNLKLNKCSENADVHNFGLGDSNYSQTIYFNSSELGESSVVFSEDKMEKAEIEIKSFDNLFENKKFKETCVVKIDIEGNEENAVEGMKNFLSTQRPILIIELWEEQSTNIKKFLHSLGYKRLHIFWFIEEKHLEIMEKMYNLYNKNSILYDYE